MGNLSAGLVCRGLDSKWDVKKLNKMAGVDDK